MIFTLKLTKFTLFHQFKHKRGLVYIENNHFVQFMKEISTIYKKFKRPCVPWVPHFSISAQNFFWHKDYFRTSIFLNPRFFQLKQFCVTKELFWIKTFSDHNFFSPRNFFRPTKFSWKIHFSIALVWVPLILAQLRPSLCFLSKKNIEMSRNEKNCSPTLLFPTSGSWSQNK